MKKPKAHVAPKKKELVAQIVKLLKEYPVVGVIDMEGLPAPQLQRIRAQLRDSFTLVMTRKSLFLHAFDAFQEKNPKITDLKQYIRGIPALIFSKENPFKLYKVLKQNKSPAAAKPGQLAPANITIPAGPTPFTPGPVISEFAQLGIKAGVEGGKVAVKEAKVVVKEGEVIKPNVASMLARLGIEPIEIGMNITALLEGSTLYVRSVLDIDEKAFMQTFNTAIAQGFNLAVEVCYPTKDTVELLLQKAFRGAKEVALEGNIFADAVMEELLVRAERTGQVLAREHLKEQSNT